MTAWSQGSPQASQYVASARGLEALFSRIERMENLIRELTGANILGPAGLAVDPDGLTIASSLVVSGNTHIQGALDVGGDAQVTGHLQSQNYAAGHTGWLLSATGLEVNDITIRGGIIGNEALASPVRPGQGGVTTGNFGMSTTASAKSAGSIAVPAGFSAALVLATAHVSTSNSTASAEFLYVGAQIGATTPAFIPHPAPAGSWVAGSGTASRVITGLAAGSSIALAAMAKSNTGTWAANASALATIDAIAVFLR